MLAGFGDVVVALDQDDTRGGWGVVVSMERRRVVGEFLLHFLAGALKWAIESSFRTWQKLGITFGDHGKYMYSERNGIDSTNFWG